MHQGVATKVASEDKKPIVEVVGEDRKPVAEVADEDREPWVIKLIMGCAQHSPSLRWCPMRSYDHSALLKITLTFVELGLPLLRADLAR
ncbi:unnamed protein product [Ilex paraguariensis]|uniref:Uncharacterized protein n=1 Tax=Ilex paraguariensis TaxID=185542 RepID=A0ABC8R4R3_9AQUA